MSLEALTTKFSYFQVDTHTQHIYLKFKHINRKQQVQLANATLEDLTGDLNVIKFFSKNISKSGPSQTFLKIDFIIYLVLVYKVS